MTRSDRLKRNLVLIWISLSSYFFFFVVAVAISRVISQRGERSRAESPIEAGIREACLADRTLFLFRCDSVFENVLALVIAAGGAISLLICCVHLLHHRPPRSQ